MATEREPLLDKEYRTDQEQHDEEATQESEPRRPSLLKRARLDIYFKQIVPGAIFGIILWNIIRAAFIENHHWSPGKGLRSEETLVPFEAHIMSKCPDAKDCLEKLVVPTMVEVSDKVNFTLSYIGRYESVPFW